MNDSMNVFTRTLAVSAICLFTIYATCFLCFAEEPTAGDAPAVETVETVEEPEQPDEESTPEDVQPEPSEDISAPEEGETSSEEPTESEVEESSSSEENPLGGGGAGGTGSEFEHVESSSSDADSADTGGDVYSVAEDVHAIRQYVEFFLFGIIPLSGAVGIIIAGCIWFRKVFIRM